MDEAELHLIIALSTLKHLQKHIEILFDVCSAFIHLPLLFYIHSKCCWYSNMESCCRRRFHRLAKCSRKTVFPVLYSLMWCSTVGKQTANGNIALWCVISTFVVPYITLRASFFSISCISQSRACLSPPSPVRK